MLCNKFTHISPHDLILFVFRVQLAVWLCAGLMGAKNGQTSALS